MLSSSEATTENAPQIRPTFATCAFETASIAPTDRFADSQGCAGLSSSVPQTQPTTFPLFRLPQELVLRVIRQLVADDCELFLSQRPHSFNLALSCRWLNTEVSKLFWRHAVPLHAVGTLGKQFEFWPRVKAIRWGLGERAEDDVWCRVLHVVERTDGKGELQAGVGAGDELEGGEIWAVKCALEPWKDLGRLKMGAQ